MHPAFLLQPRAPYPAAGPPQIPPQALPPNLLHPNPFQAPLLNFADPLQLQMQLQALTYLQTFGNPNHRPPYSCYGRTNVWVTAKPAIPEWTECPAWAHVTLVTVVMFFVVCMPPFAFACASCVMVKYFMSRHKVLLPPLPLSPVDGEVLHVQLQSTFATLP